MRARVVVVALSLCGAACARKAAWPVVPDAAAEVAAAPRVIDVQGDVKLGSAKGAPLVNGATVAVGSRVETGADGSATVRLADGRELQLGPNARVRIAEGPEGRVVVHVELGFVVSRARGADALALTIETPFGITRVPAGAGEVKVGVSDSAATVAVVVGEVGVVDRRGGVTRVGAAESIEVTLAGFEIVRKPVRAPPAPARGQVLLPTRDGLRVYGDKLDAVTLTWPAAPAGSPPDEIEVARDAGFTAIVERAAVADARFTVAAPRTGSLHWRVRRGEGPPLLGQASFFAERARPRGTHSPRNQVADTGEKATVYFQGALPALTFTFAAAPGAHAHRLQIFAANNLHNPVVERVVREPRCALPAGAVPEGRYVWHAAAVDAQGRTHGGGRMNHLELVYDNATTQLEIESTRPNGARVAVAGAAPLGSKLFVNGRPAPLDDKGRFALEVERAPALVFRLVGPRGGESYVVRALRRGS